VKFRYETLIHIFSEYKGVDVFFNNMNDWLSAKLQINFNIGSFQRLFGFQFQNNCKKELLANTLSLLE